MTTPELRALPPDFSTASWAKWMIAKGLGLNEKEIERFHNRVEAARLSRLEVIRGRSRTPADDFRELLEQRHVRGIAARRPKRKRRLPTRKK